MVILRVDPATRQIPVRPAHDQRCPDAAFEGVCLVPLQRCIARLRPAARVAAIRLRTSDAIDIGEKLVDRRRSEIRVTANVQPAFDRTTGRCAVVRQNHDDRVVELVLRFQERDQTAHLPIRVFEEAGVGFLPACREAALVVREFIPCRHVRIARREPRPVGHDTDVELTIEALGPNLVPAAVVHSAIAVHVVRRRMQRKVHCTERQIQKELIIRCC